MTTCPNRFYDTYSHENKITGKKHITTKFQRRNIICGTLEDRSEAAAIVASLSENGKTFNAKIVRQRLADMILHPLFLL